MAEVDLDLLKQLRMQNNYTIAEVSKFLGYRSMSGYYNIENSNTRVRASHLHKLAELYKVPVEKFYVQGTGTIAGNIALLNDKLLLEVFTTVRKNPTAFIRAEKHLNLLAHEIRKRGLQGQVVLSGGN